MAQQVRRTLAACVAFAVLIPCTSRAAPAPEAGDTVSELTVTASKTVDELTVTAPKTCLKPRGHAWDHEPKVVSTFPANGTVVRPGILIMRVTFDQPMACAGMFKGDPPLSDPCPGFKHQLLLSLDRLTVRTACVVDAERHYGALIRKDDDDETPFISLTGAKPHPFEFRFSTSAEAPVTTVCEALSEDEDTAREMRARHRLDCAKPPPARAGG